jgi:hypothetical protein
VTILDDGIQGGIVGAHSGGKEGTESFDNVMFIAGVGYAAAQGEYCEQASQGSGRFTSEARQEDFVSKLWRKFLSRKTSSCKI